MSNQIFKPKRELTYVPGVGAVKKADFTQKHFEACLAYVKKAGVDVDNYIKSRYEAVSFVDQPLFTESSEPKEKPSRGRKKKNVAEEGVEKESGNEAEKDSE